ncbi:hypothetical protein [Paracoccus salsus]|uniref:hypothetical protein n=1 Tax=Paracoccus salsus TaxID=2911061 RepID=UPI001F1EC222|nr:hypothetical protein [Paracoccus salsus]MCF3973467.1 hypothetical protein [Paracoccus salsus]
MGLSPAVPPITIGLPIAPGALMTPAWDGHLGAPPVWRHGAGFAPRVLGGWLIFRDWA